MKTFLVTFLIINTTYFIDAKGTQGTNTKLLNKKEVKLSQLSIAPQNMIISQAFYTRKDGSVCSIDTRNQSQYVPSFATPAYSGAEISDSGTPACSKEDKKAFKKTVKNLILKNDKQYVKKTSLAAVLGALGMGCVFGTVAELAKQITHLESTKQKTEAGATTFCDDCDKKQSSGFSTPKHLNFVHSLGAVLGGGLYAAYDHEERQRPAIKNALQTAYLDRAIKKIDPKLYTKFYSETYQTYFNEELSKHGLKPDTNKLSQVNKKLSAETQKIRELAHKTAEIRAKNDTIHGMKYSNSKSQKVYEEILNKSRNFTIKDYINNMPKEVTAKVLKPYHGVVGALFRSSVIGGVVSGIGSGIAGGIICENGVAYAFEYNKNPKTDL